MMPPFESDDLSCSKVEDPAIPNRMVSTKSANRPFLAYVSIMSISIKSKKELKASTVIKRTARNRKNTEWLKKKKERDNKIARGEEVGPLEPDPTAVQEVGLFGLLKFILYAILIFLMAGKFITGSFVWEHESKWLQLKTYLPVHLSLLSPKAAALIPLTEK